MLDLSKICQVVLVIPRPIPEIMGHKAVKMINKGKRNFTQIVMNVSDDGHITNPLGIELNGKLRIKVLSRTWIAGRNAFHYAQNICDTKGRKLQPLYVNGNFAIFSYEKMVIIQACYETGSFRLVTLCLDGQTVLGNEAMPWTKRLNEFIPAESREDWLRKYGFKASDQDEFVAAALDAFQLAKRATENIQPRPTFFLTREEAKARQLANSVS